MGLTVEVGVLATMQGDPEAVEYFQAQLDAVNAALAVQNLPPHHEPNSLPRHSTWSGEMFGYSGLHYLRRVAAHLAIHKRRPAPGDDNASEDPVLAQYFADVDGSGGWFTRLFGTRIERRFDHLIVHGDAEGYYLPFDFPEVLVPEEHYGIAGGMIGSSVRLHAECVELARILGIPAGLDPESEELWDAADSQGEGEGWRRYGIESFTCVRLQRAAAVSVRAGAAIVFC